MKGFEIYRGPSLLDGSPIVAIATLRTENEKTGDMVQVWIMPQAEAPHLAVKSGLDASVCGNCPHRPALNGTCYVITFQGPRVVYQSWQRGLYPALDARAQRKAVAGRNVRLGAWGDPAAVPVEVWQNLLTDASGWTGYTHQWASCDSRLSQFVVASADSPADRLDAVEQGWRTFRVRTEDEPLMAGEFMCPASDEGGNRTDCASCRACDGNSRGERRASAAIIVHGAKAKRFVALRAS